MKTAEEILKSKFPNADKLDWFKPIVECLNEGRAEAIKECAYELQKLRNQYEVINGHYVVSVYPIDHLIESFENKIDQIK